MYQSLHTTVIGPEHRRIEVQIRTTDMHRTAEMGIAAHWNYKDGTVLGEGEAARFRWLRELMEFQKEVKDPEEFFDGIKVDLFADEVYVFTPKGDVRVFPRGATPVDFAYAIHSDVGNTCVGAKVDRRLVPLRTPLANGQTVEVIITPTARPNPAWLSFVVTAKARSSIRHYLKNLQRDEAIILGKRMLEKAILGRIGGLGELPATRIQTVVKELNVRSFDDILSDVGLGNRLAALIAKRLLGEVDSHDVTSSEARRKGLKPLLIKGTEGTVVSFGKCCRPVPGDPVIGYLSAGRGIVVHRDSCKNVADYKKNPDKWIEVEWEREIAEEFLVELRLDVADKRGVLAAVAAAISEADSNIDTINTLERDGVTTTVNLLMHVRDRVHLARVMRRIRVLPQVLRLSRRT
jgi:RelA/SpoT family (p)ppGpp synthetase